MAKRRTSFLSTSVYGKPAGCCAVQQKISSLSAGKPDLKAVRLFVCCFVKNMGVPHPSGAGLSRDDVGQFDAVVTQIQSSF